MDVRLPEKWLVDPWSGRGMAQFVRTGSWPDSAASESIEPPRPLTDLTPDELSTQLGTGSLEAGWAGFQRQAVRAHDGQAGMSLSDFAKAWVDPHRKSS
jgi:hypothetical protein